MKSNDHPKREEKKKPEKSLKEKRAEKKAKKDTKSSEYTGLPSRAMYLRASVPLSGGTDVLSSGPRVCDK